MPRAKPPPQSDPKLAVGYTGAFHRMFDDQESIIARHVDAHRLRLIRTFDEASRDPLPSPDRRPGFVQALVELEHRGAGVFVTATVTSLASNAAEHALVRRCVERAGARWVAVDPATPWSAGDVAIVTEVLRAHESLLVKPKILVGQARKEARRGGPPPWGFRRDGDELVPNAPEEWALQQAEHMRLQGATFTEIAVYLTGLGLPGRSARVAPSTARAALQRRKKLEQK